LRKNCGIKPKENIAVVGPVNQKGWTVGIDEAIWKRNPRNPCGSDIERHNKKKGTIWYIHIPDEEIEGKCVDKIAGRG